MSFNEWQHIVIQGTVGSSYVEVWVNQPSTYTYYSSDLLGSGLAWNDVVYTVRGGSSRVYLDTKECTFGMTSIRICGEKVYKTNQTAPLQSGWGYIPKLPLLPLPCLGRRAGAATPPLVDAQCGRLVGLSATSGSLIETIDFRASDTNAAQALAPNAIQNYLVEYGASVPALSETTENNALVLPL
jgi:hypothetical protein